LLSDSREPRGPRSIDTTSVQSLLDSLPGSLLAFKYAELKNRLGAEGTDMGAASPVTKDILNFLLAEAGCDANMAMELVLVVKFGIFAKDVLMQFFYKWIGCAEPVTDTQENCKRAQVLYENLRVMSDFITNSQAHA
jgi:hypothetical protein